MATHSLQRPGVPLALASAVLFGASAPFAKLLLGSTNPQLLAGLLYLGAGTGLAIWQACRAALSIGASEAPLRCADAPWLIAIVLFGGGVGPLFLMLGLARTSAASGSLMLNLEGLATMAIAWVVFRENVDRKLMLGAAAILSGAVVLSWQMEGIQIDGGGLLIAVACLAWGIDNNLTRKLSSADPVVIALIKGVAAGATNLLLALFLGARLPSVGAIGLRSSSGSSASASVSCSSSWRCAISAAPGREPISRSRRFSARSSL
jgi:drug/metabolite transporter (DMT)-like permease